MGQVIPVHYEGWKHVEFLKLRETRRRVAPMPTNAVNDP
jgi:hypothetical protein